MCLYFYNNAYTSLKLSISTNTFSTSNNATDWFSYFERRAYFRYVIKL